MFENNADFDVGDDFSVNVEPVLRSAQNKREIKQPETPPPKKSKIQTVTAVKRKFPGPAGLLPDTPTDESAEIPCSQMTFSVFQSAPWLKVSRDFEAQLQTYNIKWIKINANKKKLENEKAPFLAAIIKNVECFEGKNALVKVVLKDLTGEIQGTVIHSLYEEFSNSLVAGTVIVLKQCGVLTTASNNHYLIITKKNLVTLYYKDHVELKTINVDSDSFCDKKEESKEADWKDALQDIDINSFFEDF